MFLQSYQYSKKNGSSDTISQMSHDSITSTDSREPVYIAAGDVRRRLTDYLTAPSTYFKVRIPKRIRAYCSRFHETLGLILSQVRTSSNAY